MSCVKEPSASWVSSLLPFLWRVECQAGNPGTAQELSEPGTLARNVVQHIFFSSHKDTTFIQKCVCIKLERVGCGNSEDEVIHTDDASVVWNEARQRGWL